MRTLMYIAVFLFALAVSAAANNLLLLGVSGVMEHTPNTPNTLKIDSTYYLLIDGSGHKLRID